MNGKITIYDIAKTAGVSPATVSRMIHQPNVVTKKTRDKILKAFELHEITPEDLSTKKKKQCFCFCKESSSGVHDTGLYPDLEQSVL